MARYYICVTCRKDYNISTVVRPRKADSLSFPLPAKEGYIFRFGFRLTFLGSRPYQRQGIDSVLPVLVMNAGGKETGTFSVLYPALAGCARDFAIQSDRRAV
jgi:hypothetical protein